MSSCLSSGCAGSAARLGGWIRFALPVQGRVDQGLDGALDARDSYRGVVIADRGGGALFGWLGDMNEVRSGLPPCGNQLGRSGIEHELHRAKQLIDRDVEDLAERDQFVDTDAALAAFDLENGRRVQRATDIG